MIRKSILLAGAAALALMTAPAMAQGEASATRGKQAGDFMIGFGVIGVLPMDSGSVDVIGGTPSASFAVTPQLDFTYFITPNLAVNLIAATSRHEVEVTGSALGTVDLGRVWALPPTLTFQYHPLPSERFSPYIGVGLNYTVFYGEGGSRTPPVTGVDIRNAFGVAFNVGLDIEVAPNWLINLDVKKLILRPDVAVDTTVGRINANADLDPWIFGIGVRYRF
jgi:outer membrane protein